MSKNLKKIGFLGPFQGKMQVLQVPLDRKNSHFSYGVNVVQEHSKKETSYGCLNCTFEWFQGEKCGSPEEKNVSMAG